MERGALAPGALEAAAWEVPAAALVCLVVAARAGVSTRAQPPAAAVPAGGAGVSGRGSARRTR
ncbi:hypothetical protein NUM3379_25790 [Kineococcus sp. NUM-3379]